jgi:hypothetical protein
MAWHINMKLSMALKKRQAPRQLSFPSQGISEERTQLFRHFFYNEVPYARSLGLICKDKLPDDYADRYKRHKCEMAKERRGDKAQKRKAAQQQQQQPPPPPPPKMKKTIFLNIPRSFHAEVIVPPPTERPKRGRPSKLAQRRKKLTTVIHFRIRHNSESSVDFECDETVPEIHEMFEMPEMPQMP